MYTLSHTLLIPFKLLAVRVYIFHVKNVFEQYSSHFQVALELSKYMVQSSKFKVRASPLFMGHVL